MLTTGEKERGEGRGGGDGRKREGKKEDECGRRKEETEALKRTQTITEGFCRAEWNETIR